MNRLKAMLKTKKIAICGIGKFQEDFEYVFDTLKPEFYISDGFNGKAYKGLCVYRTSELKACDLSHILIIVCDLSEEKRCSKDGEWNRLKQEGYQHGEDFIFADELFPTLDFDWEEEAAGRKIAIWGTGAECKKFYLSNNIRADIFIDVDKNKTGKVFNEVTIFHPEQLENRWQEYYIIVMTHEYYYQVFEYLSSKGLKEVEDFVSHHLIYDPTCALPSEMMHKVVYSVPIEGQPFCQAPFEMMHLRLDGHVIGCTCPGFTEYYCSPFGNYNYEPYERIWHSPSAKIFRLSILNNTYCFCLEHACNIMDPERKENRNVARRAESKRTEIPVSIFSEMDDVCNLVCPSCRMMPKYLQDGSEYHNRQVCAEKLRQTGWLNKVKSIGLAGCGEVFYSKVYRNLLYHQEPEKRNQINIVSNGILFNEDEFLHLMKNYKNISVAISIDGTSREVYEKLRPGANFEILMKNLEMLSVHKKYGNLHYWQLSFVVQKENYFQMKELIALAEEWGVDRVYFIQIQHCDDKSMANSDGTLKPELANYLEDPIFDKPIVYMPWFKSRINI